MCIYGPALFRNVPFTEYISRHFCRRLSGILRDDVQSEVHQCIISHVYHALNRPNENKLLRNRNIHFEKCALREFLLSKHRLCVKRNL